MSKSPARTAILFGLGACITALMIGVSAKSLMVAMEGQRSLRDHEAAYLEVISENIAAVEQEARSAEQRIAAVDSTAAKLRGYRKCEALTGCISGKVGEGSVTRTIDAELEGFEATRDSIRAAQTRQDSRTATARQAAESARRASDEDNRAAFAQHVSSAHGVLSEALGVEQDDVLRNNTLISSPYPQIAELGNELAQFGQRLSQQRFTETLPIYKRIDKGEAVSLYGSRLGWTTAIAIECFCFVLMLVLLVSKRRRRNPANRLLSESPSRTEEPIRAGKEPPNLHAAE